VVHPGLGFMKQFLTGNLGPDSMLVNTFCPLNQSAVGCAFASLQLRCERNSRVIVWMSVKGRLSTSAGSRGFCVGGQAREEIGT